MFIFEEKILIKTVRLLFHEKFLKIQYLNIPEVDVSFWKKFEIYVNI